MFSGLFGKLPAKRDFIALNVPASFLELWEPWIQAGVASSRLVLGAEWQNFFLTAPIWRFFLGAGVGGREAIGVIMPSVDGVGRYFPLTLFALADDGSRFEAPESGLLDPWLDEAEQVLLATLDEGQTLGETQAAVAAMARPPPRTPPPATDVLVRPNGKAFLIQRSGSPATDIHAARAALAETRSAGDTCWWTSGGEGYRPTVLVVDRLPEPASFAAMLTGRFYAPTTTSELRP